jgi:hypothetical protein
VLDVCFKLKLLEFLALFFKRCQVAFVLKILVVEVPREAETTASFCLFLYVLKQLAVLNVVLDLLDSC